MTWTGRERQPHAWLHYPPTAEEAIELPLHSARRWLATLSSGTVADARGDDISDLDTGRETHSDSPANDGNGRVAFRFGYGSDELVAVPVTPSALRPEDILVVRAEDGGCDEYGWNPDSRRPVLDLGDLTGTGKRKRATVRLGDSFGRVLSRVAPELASSWE
ncbi:hypothetical protein [Streptomyces sp. NPDC002851]